MCYLCTLIWVYDVVFGITALSTVVFSFTAKQAWRERNFRFGFVMISGVV